MIPFSRVSSDHQEKEAVCRIIDSGWWASGPETEVFEKEFAEYIGAKYAIFTNSCTSALEMAHRIAREMFGWHKFSYSKNTFCATYSSGVMVGQMIDFDRPDYNVTVHFGGDFDDTPCFIEDSAHRVEPNDKWIGKIKCYSLYATKNFSSASGGFFCTNDEDIYNLARLYWKDGLSKGTAERLASKPWEYEILSYSGGYDSNDILAAIGRVQLRKLPEFNKRRNEIRDRYNEAFGLSNTMNHLYIYPTENKNSLLNFLYDNGIRAGLFYPPDGEVGLPIYPLLSDEEIDFVIGKVLEWRKTTQN